VGSAGPSRRVDARQRLWLTALERASVATFLLVFAIALTAAGCAGTATKAGSTTTASPSSTAAPSTTSASTTATSPSTITTSAPTSTTTSTGPPHTGATSAPPEQLLIAGMSLEQKAAQVLMVAFDGTEPSPGLLGWVGEGAVGGVLLLGRNVVDAEQVKGLVASLQDEAAVRGVSVPLFVAVDQEGGPVQRLRDGVRQVPAARVLGETADPEEAAALAHEVAQDLLGLGINMNLAPVADVVEDPDSFLYERSYSGDPDVVTAFVEAVVAAYREEGLLTVVKHFPGHGSATGDTHTGTAVAGASRTEFEGIHLVPFRAALAAGTSGVMAAHIVAPAYDPDNPASMSATIIGGLLRGELAFSGLVVADDLEMAAANRAHPAVDALRAGCDLLITTGTYADQRAARDDIIAAVRAGDLEQTRLDDAVRCILALKAAAGIIPGD
jgi:beta-N-acetylhexosaminidase